MNQNHEVSSKLSFLAHINLGYKNEYEFGNGKECFNFIIREFGDEYLIASEKENVSFELPTSDFRKSKHNFPKKLFPIHKETTNIKSDNEKINYKITSKDEIQVWLKYNEYFYKEAFKDFQSWNNANNIELVFEKYKETELRNYKSTKQINQQFDCNICQKNFSTYEGRTEHVNMHMEKHICPFCAKMFTQKDNLLNHCTLHITQTSNKAIEKQKVNNISVKKANKPINCKICLKILSKKYNLTKHVQCNHKYKKHRVCYKLFGKEDLSKCKKTHDQEGLKCHICSQIFTRLTDIRKHLKHYHHKIKITKSNKNKFKTNGTTKQFEDKKLKELLENKENKVLIKNKTCPICSKKLITAYYVKKHIKIIHNKQKNFKCQVCKRKFATNYHLTKHLRVHTEQYSCKICLKLFSNNYYLQRHISIHPEEKIRAKLVILRDI